MGGRHRGIHVVARLKYPGVPTLVVEGNARIRGNWRSEYGIFYSHDQVCRFWNPGDSPVSTDLALVSIP